MEVNAYCVQEAMSHARRAAEGAAERVHEERKFMMSEMLAASSDNTRIRQDSQQVRVETSGLAASGPLGSRGWGGEPHR